MLIIGGMCMVGKIFAVLCIISVIFAIFSGNMSQISASAVDGAGRAVSLTFNLCGGMALWGGVMRVLEVKGVIRVFSRLMRPILSVIFPDAAKKNNGMEEISATLAANMLGIGNAATPLALKAMEKLDENNLHSERAGDDMITFAVMNTAAFSILPTGVLTMRSAVGSSDPFSVVPCIWICSAASCILSVVLCRIFNLITSEKRGEKRKKPTLYYNMEMS